MTPKSEVGSLSAPAFIKIFTQFKRPFYAIVFLRGTWFIFIGNWNAKNNLQQQLHEELSPFGFSSLNSHWRHFQLKIEQHARDRALLQVCRLLENINLVRAPTTRHTQTVRKRMQFKKRQSNSLKCKDFAPKEISFTEAANRSADSLRHLSVESSSTPCATRSRTTSKWPFYFVVVDCSFR